MADELDLDHFRRLLQQRLSELQQPTMAERDQAVELDQSKVGRLSRMDALQQQAMLDATQERNQQQRIRLELALKRLNNGDYGFCDECDAPIAHKRLQVDPANPLCIACAQAAENTRR